MLHRSIIPLTACVVLLAGCATQETRAPENSDILTADSVLQQSTDTERSNSPTGIAITPETISSGEPPKPELQVGTGKFFKVEPAKKSTPTGEADVVFNFENQPIQAVVKAILGDLLQENYTIAPAVGGNVTFSTAKPIHRSEALPVLEMLLSSNGDSLVHEDGRYLVVPTKDAIPGRLSPSTAPISAANGYELRIFPLEYVSPSEMAKFLKPYAKPEAFISIDPNRSLLVMAGTPRELENYQRTIQTFDVDWLKGMSVGVFTLQHVEVDKLLPDLQKIFGTEGESPLAGMFRFMPIEQTNAMIVITPQKEYLKQAEEWLYRLDRGGAENVTQLYVYNVKNLKAADLGDYLSQIFLGTSGSSHSSSSGGVGQGLRAVTIGGIGGRGGSNMSYGASLRPQSQREKSTPAANEKTPTPSSSGGGGGGNKDSDIRISSVEENNQLMIQATPSEWDMIESAIHKLDVQPLQVQIEARILEVTLNGNLSYGVQWYLAGLIGSTDGSVGSGTQYGAPYRGNLQDRHRSSIGATGNPADPYNGGFYWSFLNKRFEVAISALEKSTQAKTLAAPSLLVNNNQEAQINVGKQIPVVQTYVTGLSTVSGTNGNVNTGYGNVQYLNTGIVLDVKPRVNPGGLVYLDISQEVSSPTGEATTNGNPPIAQRQLQTQVAVQSGQTLMLGGLIQDTRTEGQTGVPLLSKIPLVRNLFGNTSSSNDRTELIVLITPRVINNTDEARQVTEEYMRRFQSLAPLTRRMTNTPDAAPAPKPAAPEPPHQPAKPQEDSSSDQ